MLTIADSLRAEGRAEGELKGELKGRTNTRLEIVTNMINKGLNDDFIQDVTGMTLNQIMAIRNQIDASSST